MTDKSITLQIKEAQENAARNLSANKDSQVQDTPGVEAGGSYDPQPINKSLLLIGDPGAGKTKFLGTCPRELWIADFDKGSATLEDDGPGITAEVFKDAPLGRPAMPQYGIYEYGKAWEAFQDSFNAVGKLIDEGTCPYLTLALDSFTMLQQCIMNHVLSNSKHPAGPVEIQDYGTLLNIQKTFFDQFSSWPLLKIVTAHVQRTTNDLNESLEMLPLGLGSFTARLPMYFDEVYYLEVKNATPAEKVAARKANKPEPTSRRILTTQPTGYIKAARTRKNVPDGLPPDFKAIEPYLRPRVK